MDDRKHYLTTERRRELESELENLQNVKRSEILGVLEFAKSLGDLSENAEYHQAREDQRKLEERIYTIQNLLKSATTAVPDNTGRVGIGSFVAVRKQGDKKDKIYQVVGSEESDMKEGKISYHSPVGVALIGCKKGESVTFKTPAGSVTYKIISIK